VELLRGRWPVGPRREASVHSREELLGRRPLAARAVADDSPAALGDDSDTPS